jgi:hypothetical protein
MTTMMQKAVRLLTVLLAVALIGPQPFAMAQAAPGGSPARSSVLSTGGGQALLDPSDTVMLLLDHQAGLFQTVKDINVAELRANTIALAKLATLLNIPVITSASEPNGMCERRRTRRLEALKGCRSCSQIRQQSPGVKAWPQCSPSALSRFSCTCKPVRQGHRMSTGPRLEKHSVTHTPHMAEKERDERCVNGQPT